MWGWIRSLVIVITCAICWSTLAAPSQHLTQVGDLIYVNLPGEDSLTGEYAIDERGRIILPEAGSVDVAQLDEVALKKQVKEALKRVYRDLDSLEVYILEKRLLLKVYGYVENPGLVILPADASVQMALAKAGGLRAGAQLNKLQLRRGNQTQTFNYKAYLDSGDSSTLPSLEPLDTLFVPASPMTGNIEVEFDPAKMALSGDASETRSAIKVFGEVNSPGSFSYKPGNSLVDLIMQAGGVTRYAGVEQIRVIIDNEPKTFNLKRYLDTGDSSHLPQIAEGTTIFVPKQEEEIKSGANTVYVMGEVFKPGAYEGKEGATFIDILANAGGPTRFAESRQIRIIKGDGSIVPFDMTAYTEGQLSRIPSVQSGDAIFVPEKTDMNEKSWLKVAPDRAVNVIGEVVRPGRYEWSNEMSLLDLLAHAGGPTSRADTSNIDVLIPQGNNTNNIKFNLDSYIKSAGKGTPLPAIVAGTIIRVHDLPQDPSDNKSQWVRQSSEKSIYIFGQVGAPGRYRFNDDMHFLDILSAADGPTDQADIHNIRVSHRNGGHARVSKLNLALYFETGDEHLLPKVQTGDTIYVPEKDRLWLSQSKETTVRVLGAVNKPGRYRFDDTMTILDLLAEAGGPTDKAYLEKVTIVNLSCCKDKATTFDLLEFSQTADFDALPLVRVGDTVYVPSKEDSNLYKAREGLTDIFQLVSIAALIGLF
ncbi:SLBB domain-containing protein [Motilimonas sp. KMU-193]|uniref:SLBB domain-containing protein n=1 Tax=Motilimonas sp. KMU-193 TaxID=3388668 RepID=UPI00396B14E4